jgi:hypothetical protein
MRLLLYAVPNTGAALAGLGQRLSFGHHHLKQLCRDADVLEVLNGDWTALKVRDRLRTLYVIGAMDQVVTPQSARGPAGEEEVRTIAEGDHSTIIQPYDAQDIRYAVLKQFVLGRVTTRTSAPGSAKVEGDPLFDTYSEADKPHYVKREIDKTVSRASSHRALWLFGASGFGKTTLLRHVSFEKGYRLQHLLMASYEAPTPLDLVRAVCTELLELSGNAEEAVRSDATLATLVATWRRSINALRKDGPVAILIEEMPISPGTPYQQLLGHFEHLISSIEREVASGGLRESQSSASCSASSRCLRGRRPNCFLSVV